MSLNKVLIIGNIARKPELKQAGTTNVANTALATNERTKDGQVTEWHNLVFFGRQAEIASEYLDKGSKIYIEGRIKTDKYTDKNGVEKEIKKIIVSNLKMLDSKASASESATTNSVSTNQQTQAQADFVDDDIPF